MKKIKVGIIGFGLSGRVFHAPLICGIEGLEISKIYTRNEESIAFARENYPQAEVVDNSGDITRGEDIDLVIIATPNKLHFKLAKEAMENGKHVVIEKPFVVNSEEGEELIRISKRENRVLSVYHNRRFDSDIKTIQGLIEEHKLGDVVQFESTFNRFRPYLKDNWREKEEEGSGILFDLGSHLIDQALIMFGMPTHIQGDVRIQRKCANVDDYFKVILYYGEEKNNMKVELSAGMMVREGTEKFRVIGDKGTYIKYGLDIQEGELRAGKYPHKEKDWGVEPEMLWGELYYEDEGTTKIQKIESERGDYPYYYENIYKAIAEGEELAVKAEEALEVIKVIEMVQRSSKDRCIIKI